MHAIRIGPKTVSNEGRKCVPRKENNETKKVKLSL
jgi:hypothetical protein